MVSSSQYYLLTKKNVASTKEAYKKDIKQLFDEETSRQLRRFYFFQKQSLVGNWFVVNFFTTHSVTTYNTVYIYY